MNDNHKTMKKEKQSPVMQAQRIFSCFIYTRILDNWDLIKDISPEILTFWIMEMDILFILHKVNSRGRS